jgi:hypothetical protein
MYVAAGKYTVQPEIAGLSVSPYELSYDRPNDIVVHNGGCTELQFLTYRE